MPEQTAPATSEQPSATTPEYVLRRRFAAPVELVWRAWTEPDLMVRWLAPMPQATTTLKEAAIEPGGTVLCEMEFGAQMPPHRWRLDYIIVEPPRLLSWRDTILDDQDAPKRNPRNADWPLFTQTTITLDEQDGGTLLTMRVIPVDASPTEIEAFRAGMEQLGFGWNGGLANLERLLSELA